MLMSQKPYWDLSNSWVYWDHHKIAWDKWKFDSKVWFDGKGLFVRHVLCQNRSWYLLVVGYFCLFCLRFFTESGTIRRKKSLNVWISTAFSCWVFKILYREFLECQIMICLFLNWIKLLRNADFRLTVLFQVMGRQMQAFLHPW